MFHEALSFTPRGVVARATQLGLLASASLLPRDDGGAEQIGRCKNPKAPAEAEVTVYDPFSQGVSDDAFTVWFED